VNTGYPFFFVAYRMNYFGFRVFATELSPIMGGRPVDTGRIAGKYDIPVHFTPFSCTFPEWQLLRVVADLKHVMTRSKAK
jgi:hypothetical protein